MTARLTRIVRVVSLLGVIIALGLLAGCAGTTPAPAKTSSAGGEIGPMTVEILEPTDGAEVAAGTVTVGVETTGITFAMPSNTLVAGEGHVHFTLDDRPFVMSVEKQATLEDVEPGSHTLKAELVQNDTQSFSPPVEQTIEFTAK